MTPITPQSPQVSGLPDVVIWTTTAALLVLSIVLPAVLGGGWLWLLTAVMVPLLLGFGHVYSGYLRVRGRKVRVTDPIFIAPEGELDVARVGEFREALSAAAAKPGHGVVVDLSRLKFIDSSGLGALVETHNRLRRENRQLAVIAPGGTAAAVLLNLSGLQARLPTYEDREAAAKHAP